jgi:hypothetical protein
MKFGVIFALAALMQTAFSHTLPDYHTATSNGYAAKPTCTFVDEVEYKEKCEPYKDKVCYTSHEEMCEDVYDQTCRSFISKSQIRKCFNVTETVCTLKEDVSYEVIDAVFTVQKCSRAFDKVCDTVYAMEETKIQREECILVPSFVCTSEEKTVHEKTCRTETKFDCDTGRTSGGYGTAAYQPTSIYGHVAQSSYNTLPVVQTSYDSRAGQGQQPDTTPPSTDTSGEYGTEEPKCKTHQETRCNTTPRQLTSQSCKKSEEKVCDQITERHPKPYEKAHCRNEGKKVCRVEQKTQPKQIKKYIYKQVCSPLVKKVCDIWDDHKLVPTCVPTLRHICSHKPKEHCEDVDKQHCYKIPMKVRKEKCETTQDPYPTDPPTPSYQ